MADTIADVVLGGTAYQDLYDATSIAAGTTLIIQNKSTSKIWLQVKATTPAAASRAGVVV